MPRNAAQIALKRVYDEPAASDGVRVLVDRLWPRGLTKEEARADLWLRDLAPSNELRKWYHAHMEQWPEFRKRYLQELGESAAAEALDQLRELISQKNRVTLLFASKELERNNATVLKDLLERKK
jgi:uncharacterized protein YeaO (DUF488 family)